MKILAQKAAIIFCAVMVFFLGCLILGEPWLFSGSFIAVGFVSAIYFAVLKKKRFKAVAIVVCFGLVGLFGHNLHGTVIQWFEPRAVQAATESTSVQAPAPTEEPKCIYDGRYPETVAQWCFLIEAEAAEYGMDPLLIAALIVVESNGQPEPGSTVQIIDGVERHTSSSGAVGLMQVMPRDGISADFQCENGPCFADRPTTAELVDPAFNVDFGVRMLSGLVTKKGDIREALKAYGPDPQDCYVLYGNYYWYADKILTLRQGL